MADTLKQLNELDIQVQTEFQINFEEISSNKETNWFPQLATTIQSGNKMEVTQAFLFDHANIQETNFGQPPDYHLMQGEKAVIPLKIYNDAVAVSAYDLADDAFGLIANRVSDLGKRAALHPKDLAVDILENGDTSTDYVIYDGQQFFSNTHTKPNSVNIDNLMAGTLDTTNYQAVRTAMRRFASDLGPDDVYGIAPTHTIVPPDLEVTINQIIHNSLLPVTNFNTENAVLKGSSIPIVEPRLTDVNDWYVATTELGVSPFIEIRHNTFGSFDLISETSDSDPSFRDHHQRRWWIRAVMTVFPTRPETMIKVVNA
jgi:phage major head subunit gpT-like protein